MTKEPKLSKQELEIAMAACCVGTMWDEYEGTEDFDHMVRLRLNHLIELVRKSQPSLPSNLDEAAKEYMRNYIPFDQCDSRDIICTFKAGAEWMSLQSTRARLAVKSNTPEGKDAYEKVAKEMRASVAAKDYGEGIYCPILKHKNKTGLNCTAVEDAFLKGAEWMAGQGVTVDAKVCKLIDRAWVTILDEKQFQNVLYDKFNLGDKVVVQIRKK